jgi:hypothetical protein
VRYNDRMSFYDRLRHKYPLLERIPVQHLKRHWLTVSFFVGFIVDNLTLNRVDQLFDNVVLASYVILAMASLFVLYAATAGRVPEQYEPYVRAWAPLATQFAFGGLLSGMLIFYGRSGSWFSSWPFLLVMFAVIYGNETITQRAQRLLFNLVILFVGVFLYVVLIVPVLTGYMGAWVFVASGVVALAVMYGFIALLKLVVPNFMRANTRLAVFAIGIAYAGMNFLYFANIIPPIPLSLKELGIYHLVEKVDENTYSLTYEKGKWSEPFKDSDKTFHYQVGDTVYCFASVFAPTRLHTEIFHRWEYYVPEDKEWRTHGRFSYSIGGGRGEGFRGYTLIESVTEGTWRCTVETARKQILGRETFEITRSGTPGELVKELR